jgi:large subunit ribosomal protein L20
MARVKGGTASINRHKKVIKLAKGYRGRSKNCHRIAIERVEKALQYAYRDRRAKKGQFRALWIQRINAGAREHGLTYATFMGGLTAAGILLDRKVLADIAVRDAAAFAGIVAQAKEGLASKKKAA